MFGILKCLFTLALAAMARAAGGSVWVTPHDKYSSSVGVLGCKIDTNRVAYWPASVDCTNICVSLSYENRTVHLLRIDQSGGAHDVSYDAWNYLLTGFSATEKPTTGGGIAMEYQDADPSACADLIHTDDGKLPLSAPNSMNYLASCLAQDSWVGKNYALFNIVDAVCCWGYDEPCKLDWPAANQAACPNTMGFPAVLTTAPVTDIEYGTGRLLQAGTGQSITSEGSPSVSGGTPLVLNFSPSRNGGRFAAKSDAVMVVGMVLLTHWIFCRI